MHHSYQGEEWKRADDQPESKAPLNFKEKLSVLNLRFAHGYISQLDWSASFDHLMMPEGRNK